MLRTMLSRHEWAYLILLVLEFLRFFLVSFCNCPGQLDGLHLALKDLFQPFS